MQLIANIILTMSLYIIVALSFIVIYYTVKFYVFSHAVIITSGAFLYFLFSYQFNLSFWLSFPIVLIISVCVGVLLEFCLFKYLRRKGNTTLILTISSLGIYIILQNVISIIWGDDVKIMRLSEMAMGHEIWGAYITDIQIITIVVSALCVGLSMLYLKYSKVGRRIRAVSANSELANVQGIDSDRVILWATGIGSGMAAIAGILVGFDTGLTPTMGFNLLLYGIVAMIIGGVGSTKGLIGGAFLLAAAQHLTAYYIDSKWMNAITYIILIAFLIWRPLGFSGQRLKKIEI